MPETRLVGTWRSTVYERIEQATLLEKSLYVLGFAALTALLAQVRIYAPWNPFVPYTGQVLGVVGTGLVLGPGLGMASMLVYLVLGAAGLPVFADWSGGLGVLVGATAGYLYAYPLAAMVVGLLSRDYMDRPTDQHMARLGLWALGGLVLLFGLGGLVLGVSDLMATQGLGLTMLVSSILVAGLGVLLWVWAREESTAFLARMAAGLIGVLIIYALGLVVLKLVTGMTWSTAMAQGVIQFVPVDLAKVFVAAGGASFLLPPRERGFLGQR